MRKLILLILTSIVSLQIVQAETYGNEWVDSDLTYYRFKVADEGLHRVYKSALISAGVSENEIIGEHAKLIVQGQEKPIYVSTQGIFEEKDYIEFYGEGNDGNLDRELYIQPEYHPNEHVSLFTDTAVYYLTFDATNEHLRYEDVENVLEDLPPKEEYFFESKKIIETRTFRPGMNPTQLLSNVYSSEFDVGEGFSSNNINFIGLYTNVKNFGILRIYNEDSTIKSKVRGSLLYRDNSNHQFSVTTNDVLLGTFSSNRAGVEKFELEIPHEHLNNRVQLNGLTENTKMAVYWMELIYPRNFNFQSQGSKLKLAVHHKKAAYIEVERLVNRDTDILIYDLKNNHRYTGVRDRTLTKFHFIETQFDKDSLYLSSQDDIDIVKVEYVEQAHFPVIEEANYIVITTKELTSDAQGVNYVQQYVDYRRSQAGGGHSVHTYYIDELENAFSYGIKGHPNSVRKFINYLMDHSASPPEMLFIIGKGYGYDKHRNTDKEFVPTFGHPASDNLLVARSNTSLYPQVGVGRLSARDPSEIKIYLDKVKLYEQAQKFDGAEDQTLKNKEWMKSILHLGGGNFLDEQQTFARYLENYKKIIEGQNFGGNVHSVYKSSTDPVQVAQSAIIDSMIINGTSLVTFFGHSSTSTVDFDIEPESFKNPPGKYPLMFTNGCFIGDIFDDFNSYSERFVIAPDRAIGYLAPMTYAIAYSLNQYANNFYNRLGVVDYSKPIGAILKNTAVDILGSSLQTDRFLAQQMIYHGDPAIKLNSFEKPDYIITEEQVKILPEVVNASVDTFQLVINHKNIGMALDTTYKVFVERSLPNGEIEIYEEIVKTPLYSDVIVIHIPTNNINGLGQNKFYIKIDSDDEIDELSENNNEVTFTAYFTIDDLLPVIPAEYSIVNSPNLELQYSTANPLIGTRNYIVQIDTTEFFNSPLLISEKVTSSGGVVQWKPSVNLLNNVVYYWRGSLDTIYNNEISWNSSSFLYNTTLSEGWNQSHYFQFIPDSYDNMRLKDDRMFSFIDDVRSIKVYTGIDAVGYNDRVLFADNNLIARNSFTRGGYHFYVLDTKTGRPMSTYMVGNTGYGEYGNVIVTLLTDVKIIEFETATQKGRYSCYNFLKNIVPDQAIICGYSSQNPFYSLWGTDDSTAFGGETLFDAFEHIGVTDIRSVQEMSPFVFFTQKGNPNFETQQIAVDRSEAIDVEFFYTGTSNQGRVLSPLIGPALGWNTVDYNWTSLEEPTTDEVEYNLYGYSPERGRVKLFEDIPQEADISFINSDEYPFLQLEFDAKDLKNSTAPQLDYWRVIYEEVPEGAMNPKLHFSKTNDTIPYGSKFKGEIAFENITDIDMDSILVKFTVKDASGHIEEFYKRYAPLLGREYIVIDFEYTFDQIGHQGVNTVIFEANPDDDQKEKHHFNNFAFFTVILEKDILNPLLDVTFDGRHITDGEIVSPNPEVLIKLKDENKYLALDDSLAFKVFLKMPNASKPIALDLSSHEFDFIPADESRLETINEAKLFYRPELLEDGIYELRVQGADKSMNDAGKNEYRVQFKIDSRPAISNILNYPNPFSTSTQFIFTVTGTEVPTDLKIQIMTITGKVVKEITAEELGYIHIGENRTDYKWDGRDTYGDKLANGLYLYRVIARQNGKKMDLLEGSADKYFKKGFGKMYIVR